MAVARQGSAGETPALRQSAVDGVTEYLRAMIHRGEVVSGEALPSERQLAETLGVGRVTLRAGIRHLTEEGYLVAKRGASGGTFVTGLTEPHQRWLARMRENLHDLEDIFEYRTALERWAVKLAASRRTKKDLTLMTGAIAATRSSTSVDAYRSADSSFHLAVAAAARSPRISAGIADSRQSLFTMTDALPYDAEIRRTGDEHAEIHAAILAKDGELGAHLMEAHIDRTRLLLRSLIRSAK
jgi:GntR family transcriptional repressor for pyruvate dehydrogenase complex